MVFVRDSSAVPARRLAVIPPPMRSERGRAPWVTLVALALLGALLALGFEQWRASVVSRAPDPVSIAPAPADTSDAVIGQAGAGAADDLAVDRHEIERAERERLR